MKYYLAINSHQFTIALYILTIMCGINVVISVICFFIGLAEDSDVPMLGKWAFISGVIFIFILAVTSFFPSPSYFYSKLSRKQKIEYCLSTNKCSSMALSNFNLRDGW